MTEKSSVDTEEYTIISLIETTREDLNSTFSRLSVSLSCVDFSKQLKSIARQRAKQNLPKSQLLRLRNEVNKNAENHTKKTV